MSANTILSDQNFINELGDQINNSSTSTETNDLLFNNGTGSTGFIPSAIRCTFTKRGKNVTVCINTLQDTFNYGAPTTGSIITASLSGLTGDYVPAKPVLFSPVVAYFTNSPSNPNENIYIVPQIDIDNTLSLRLMDSSLNNYNGTGASGGAFYPSSDGGVTFQTIFLNYVSLN